MMMMMMIMINQFHITRKVFKPSVCFVWQFLQYPEDQNQIFLIFGSDSLRLHKSFAQTYSDPNFQTQNSKMLTIL